MEAYSRVFSFVEVNSTFYEIPDSNLAELWRRRVPQSFEFAVLCHNSLTHKYRLEPVEESFETFSKMKVICRILNSRFLVLVTPSSLTLNKGKLLRIKDFFESVNARGIRVVWETRHQKEKPIPSNLFQL